MDFGAVSARNFPDDGEPETCASGGASRHAMESVENAQPLLLRNSRSVVFDTDFNAGRYREPYRDHASRTGAVTKRIVDQIVQHLGQHRRIAPDRHRAGLSGETQVNV